MDLVYNCFHLVVSLTLLLTSPLSFAQNHIFPQTSEAMMLQDTLKHYYKSKTVAHYVESLKNYMRPDSYKFLKQKIHGEENAALPKIVQLSDQKMQIQIDSSLIPFEVIDLATGKFAINNKIIQFSLADQPEVLWQRIVKSLPTQLSSNLYNLFFPEANAFITQAAFVTLTATMFGTIIFIYETKSCTQVTNNHTACVNGQTRLTELSTMNIALKIPYNNNLNEINKIKELINNISEKKGDATSLLVSCRTKVQDVKICINALLEKADKTFGKGVITAPTMTSPAPAVTN